MAPRTIPNILLLGILICLAVLIWLKLGERHSDPPAKYDRDRVGRLIDASLPQNMAREAMFRARQDLKREE